MEKVSVIIPVFRESDFLEGTLDKFLADRYRKKEIIVAMDEPTEKSLDTVRKFKKRVTFSVSRTRRGKASALNEVAKSADGDILFFFDSDNKIPGRRRDAISNLVREMSGNEIAEFKTDIIKDSRMSKIVSFDYINSNMVSLLYSKFVGMKPAIGGMAFAIRRESFEELGGFKNVVAEDVDIGWRAFEKGKRYKLVKSVPIMTKSPSNLKEWFTQRKRWAIGTADWFAKSPGSILTGNVKKAPYLTVPSLLLVLPTLLLGLISLLISESVLEQIIIFTLAVAPLKLIELSGFAFLVISSITVLKSLVMYAIGFSISVTSTFVASRLLNQKFGLADFVIFYFLYSPMVLATYVYGFLSVVVFRNTKLSDWKV